MTEPNPEFVTASFLHVGSQSEFAGTDSNAPFGDAGRYQLLNEVARGGMGAVLRARDVTLNRELAVKVLLEKYAENPEVLGRFLEEAQIGGQLQHPGIVPIYDLGHFADKRPFFAMKFVKGQTLADMLKARTSPHHDLPEFLRIFQQICETMAYAHSKGVIHRDLKPLNIMVGAFGEVQVMDWGLAKVLDRNEPAASEVQASVVRTGRTEAGSAWTRYGDLMGTVAYMSPEQARGEMNRLDERADVFALGSILCEILTTKAAYTGRSSQELLDKAKIGALPDALKRLDACGAEPELISIAESCLSPIAEDRPRDAAAVAGLTKSYVDGVQERLRAAELAEVQAKAQAQTERTKRKFTVALAASLLLAGTIGGGSWLAFRLDREAQLAKADSVVGDALARAETLQAEAKRAGLDDLEAWMRAMFAAETTRDALSVRPAHADLARRVGQLYTKIAEGTKQARDRADRRESGRKLVAALEEARLESARVKDNHFDTDATLIAYEKAFRDVGVDAPNRPPEESARMLDGRGDCVQIAAALDHWKLFETDKARQSSLSALARRIDPDPYRNRIRDALDRANAATTLIELAGAAEADSLSADSVRQLSELLWRFGKNAEAISLLDRSRTRFPADFWIHQDLGIFLRGDPAKETEATRFLSVAVALKPDSPGAHFNLANALSDLKRYAEAEASYRAALRRKPDYASAHGGIGLAQFEQKKFAEAEQSYQVAIRLQPNDAKLLCNLGLALLDQNKRPEAIEVYRSALRVQPDIPQAHCNLGLALFGEGKVREAVESFRFAIRLDPNYASAYRNLGDALFNQDKFSEAVDPYRAALRFEPDDYKTHHHLGRALLNLGRSSEAIESFQASIRLKGDDADVHVNLGVALVNQGKTGEAIESCTTAIRLNPNHVEAHYNLGRALELRGKITEAIDSYQTAIRLRPDLAEAHCNLGHLLRGQGRLVEALDAFKHGHELGSKRANWGYPSADWLAQCERLVKLEPRLAALLKGAEQADDNADRLVLGQWCYDTGRFARSARFWGDALEKDPNLSSDCRLQRRYNAACAASLAGSGQGIDDPKPDEAACIDLRSKARRWLIDELAAWATVADSGKAGDREVVSGSLIHWKQDTDLAAIRDPDALSKLSEDERKAFQALWADVDALLKRASANP